MCLCPVHIKNPALKVYPGIPLYLDVPCGNCSECKQRKRDDYFIRALEEVKQTALNGGFTYFETLTYNDEHLPRHFGFPCFNGFHIRLFFQKLKRAISKKGYYFSEKPPHEHPDYVKASLRYLISSEYGDNSHRPHYHGLFHVVAPGLSVYDFKSLIDQSWDFGFCNPKKGVRVVHGVTEYITPATWLVSPRNYYEIAYVAKYTVKQSCFDHYYKDCLEQIASGEVHLSDDDKDIDLTDKNAIYKALKPIVRVSNGYGATLLDKLTDDEKDSLKLKLVNSPKGIDKYYVLPRYIHRKLHYDICSEVRSDGNKYVMYVRNDLGIDYKIKHSYDEIDRLAQNLDNTLANLNKFVDKFYPEGSKTTRVIEKDELGINRIINLDDPGDVYTSLLNCKNTFEYVKERIDTFDIATYMLFYHHTFQPGNDIKFFDLDWLIHYRYDPAYSAPVVLDYLLPVSERLKPVEHCMFTPKTKNDWLLEQFCAFYDLYNRTVRRVHFLGETNKEILSDFLKNYYET